MNYQVNESKICVDIADGTAILLEFTTGIYYGLNEFATEIFSNIINNGCSVEEIIEGVEKFENAPSDIKQTINKFINDLCEYELIIEIDKDEKSNFVLSESIAESNNYIPEIKRYDDVQEMLMADPIHEVKEEIGWSPEASSINEDRDDVKRREDKFDGNL